MTGVDAMQLQRAWSIADDGRRGGAGLVHLGFVDSTSISSPAPRCRAKADFEVKKGGCDPYHLTGGVEL